MPIITIILQRVIEQGKSKKLKGKMQKNKNKLWCVLILE